MIINFYNGGAGSVSSGEVENMISSALTDYYTSTETDSAIDDAVSGKADTSALTEYYTSGQTDSAISTALAGYYTSGQTDSAISTALGDYYTSGQTDSAISTALGDYYTSGQTDSAISTALGDYYTSGETDAAISDAISDINFDKLASVSAFPQSANTGDVVAKVTEGAIGVYQYDGTDWNAVGGGAGGNANIVELTQAQYDALVDKDEDAIYVITDAQAIDLGDYATNDDVDTAIATKADAQSVTPSTGTSDPYPIPSWNEQGVVTGEKNVQLRQKIVWINNTANRFAYLSGSPQSAINIFTPTTVGTAGQILKSNGVTTPVWTDFTEYTNGISFWKGTQAEYDAITTKDASTLYIITD